MSKLHNLPDRIDNLTVPTRPLTDAERDRILARACTKAGLEPPAAGGKTLPFPAAPAGAPGPAPRRKATADTAEAAPRFTVRRARRPQRVLAAAAAVAVAASLGVAAVGPALLHLAKGEIGFFAEAPATAEDALDAPLGGAPAAAAGMANHTAAIGQTVTDGGLTVTLDSVAMDAASLDAFFTLQADNLVPDFLAAADFGPQPDWGTLAIFAPNFLGDDLAGPRINGEACCAAGATVQDFYRVDDDTIRLWLHFPLTALPDGDSLTVTLTEASDNTLFHAGRWSFSFTLDAAEVKAGGRFVAPGVYDIGQTVTLDPDGPAFDAPLRITRLAFGAGGGVLATDGGDIERAPDNTVTGTTAGWDPGRLAISDDAGRPVYWLETGDLTALSADAAALTLTPLQGGDSAASLETRTVTTAELAAGAQLATSPLGGFTVQNFAIEGNEIRWELVPYGAVALRTELSPDDGGLPVYSDAATMLGGAADGETVAMARTAFATETVDPATGVRHCRIFYYAADEADLRGIETWRYTYVADLAPDTAHAVTLALDRME